MDFGVKKPQELSGTISVICCYLFMSNLVAA